MGNLDRNDLSRDYCSSTKSHKGLLDACVDFADGRNDKFPSRDDTKSQSKNDQAPSFAVIHSTGEKFAAAAATIPRAISRAVIDIRARARVRSNADQSYFCRSAGTMTRTWNVAIRDSFPRRNSGIRGYSARVELTSLATLLFASSAAISALAEKHTR